MPRRSYVHNLGNIFQIYRRRRAKQIDFSLLRVKRTVQGIHTMFRTIIILSVILPLAACNSVYVKPNSYDTSKQIFVPRGGFSMQRSIKLAMQNRDYKIYNGRLTRISKSSESYEFPSSVQYSVRVDERSEIFRPIWCMFNGFWWWNFNVSIVEQKTGTEILSWRGRGCQNSSLRKLDELLETMEIK